MRLKSKIALITGGGKGLGLAIASKFLEEGCFVYIGLRDLSTLTESLQILSLKYPESLQIIQLDITRPEDGKLAFQQIKKEKGKIDILVNNAGIVSYELVPFINFEHFEKMFQTNVVGLMRLSQLASRLMTRQNSGSIVNISSIVSVKGAAGQASYAATKGAVNAFTMSLAKELAPSQVRVNAVAPGMIATERLIEVSEEKFRDKIKDVGLGRMASTEEIANICLFLASDESMYVTGQIISADGSLKI